MNDMGWLVRAARWARHPPSARRVWLVLAIVAAGMAIAGLEHMGWWPDWATAERGRMPRLPR